MDAPTETPPPPSPVAPVRPSARIALATTTAALASGAVLYGLKPAGLVGAYLEHVYPTIVAVTGPVSHALPVQPTELLGVSLAAFVLARVGVRIACVARKRERPSETLRALGLGLATLLSSIFLVTIPCALYVLATPTVEERLALEPRRATGEDLLAAALKVSPAIVEARRAMGPAPRLVTTRALEWLATGPTRELPVDPAEVQSASRAAITEATAIIEGREFSVFASPRAPVPGTLFHHYGIAGRTIPLLGEVCVSPYMSAVEYGWVLAHEYAHAAGIIREREADFYAFVGASRSPCALLRYSTLVSARNHLLAGASKAGIGDAWDRGRAALPADVEREIELLARLYQERGFAPGGTIQLKEEAPGEPPTPEVTAGEAPGTAPIAVYQAVSTSAGLPLDYDSSVPLMALWIARQP